MFERLLNFFKVEKPTYRIHPLADKREALADQLEMVDYKDRLEILRFIEEDDPELYESWILDPYPGPGDHQYR